MTGHGISDVSAEPDGPGAGQFPARSGGALCYNRAAAVHARLC